MKKRTDTLNALQEALVRKRESLRRMMAGGLSLDPEIDTDTEEVTARLIATEEKELQHIELALDRIKDGGDYGVCEDCGKNIPTARLEALPYALRCIKCQELFEASGDGEEECVDYTKLE